MTEKITLDGVFEKGYGYIPRLVMQDRSLDIIAKALYSYLCSFSGKEKSCYPSRDKICYDLRIGKDTFTRYAAQLSEAGYIVVEKVRENGRFLHNVYTIADTPCPMKTDKARPDKAETDKAKPDEEASDKVKADTINNKITNTNSKNNNFTNTTIEKEKRPPMKAAYGKYSNVFLSDREYAELREEFPISLQDWIEQLSAYIESSGKKYNSHAATIRNWAKRERQEVSSSKYVKGLYNHDDDDYHEATWNAWLKLTYGDAIDEEEENRNGNG